MERNPKGDDQPTLDISAQRASAPRQSAGRSGAGRTLFAPGDMVAERYRIVAFVARGGMGEVYEAEDTLLRACVALKTIRAEIVEDQHVVERFKREINLARKVSHPNVCRSFDIGVHRFTDAAAGEVTFLTMEFLSGETLEELLHREGRMTPATALPLVRQMVAGGWAPTHNRRRSRCSGDSASTLASQLCPSSNATLAPSAAWGVHSWYMVRHCSDKRNTVLSVCRSSSEKPTTLT